MLVYHRNKVNNEAGDAYQGSRIGRCIEARRPNGLKLTRFWAEASAHFCVTQLAKSRKSSTSKETLWGENNPATLLENKSFASIKKVIRKL